MTIRTSLLVLLTATPAMADGPGSVPPPLPVASAVTDWSGSYGGFTLGGVASDGEAERAGYEGSLLTLDVENGLFPGEIDDQDRSAMLGLRYGRNRQSGALVTGFEIDLGFSNLEAEPAFSRVDPNPAFPFTGVDTVTGYRTELDALMTARLRAGFAAGRTLFYATGGVAVGDVENTFTLALPNLPAVAGGPYANDWSEEGMRLGYVLGAGVERKVSERMSLTADIMRFDLEDVEVEATDPDTFGSNRISYEFQNSGYVARIGVNFAF